MSDGRLPKFDNPPVLEVALSILFESLTGFRSAHAGRLWDRIKDQFPTTEDQPELAPSIEEPSVLAAKIPRLEFLDRPRLRTWFQTLDGAQLLQVQHNRIAYNGKKSEAEAQYPSYEAVERRFRELLPVFLTFVADEGLGEITPHRRN